MRISLKWLADYVALPADPTELARRLTMAGLEVEGVERPGEALSGVVVATILASTKHPNADKLSVTSIDFGSGTPLQVVCGAKNYQVGDLVPLATVGTRLPGGLNIEKSDKRGVESFGMLCSARELGISEQADGLLILDPALPVGTPIARALGLDDVIFEVNVTPNRPDALCHLGIAREVATLLGTTVKSPLEKVAGQGASSLGGVSVRIDDPTRCLRYAAKIIEGVKVAPSPAWLQQRLTACGVRAINNLVDVTNYVMLEVGQPLHAFDLDQLAGSQIVVRLPKGAETLKTLDDKVRTLHPDDLVIADRDRAVALAGVMGGATSEVTAATTRVLLESATFAPGAVRRTAKRHALHSESSHRFERGTDLSAVAQVAERAAALIAELGGGRVLPGLIDVYPHPKQPLSIDLRPSRVSEVLGVEVPMAEQERILETLGFVFSGQQRWQVPAARVDVTGEEDLIEEVARIRGYESIPVALPRGLGALAPAKPEVQAERIIRRALAGLGIDEVVNYSFVSPAELEAFGALDQAITLTNPLSVEQSVMRTTLFASLVPNVVRSARHQAAGVRFYEWGRSYRPDPQGGQGSRPVAFETQQVAGVLWGLREGARTWTAKDAACDFYDAKGAVQSVLQALHIEGATYEPLESSWYHPRAAASVKVSGVTLGTVGELHPRAAKRLEAPAGVFLFQLEVDALVKAAKLVPKAVGLGKFPAVLRDIALVVKLELPHQQIQAMIAEVGRPLVEDVQLFDVYTGAQIAAGHKNVAYALRYRAPDRTLTDAEVYQVHERIVAEVNTRLGGSVRKAE